MSTVKSSFITGSALETSEPIEGVSIRELFEETGLITGESQPFPSFSEKRNTTSIQAAMKYGIGIVYVCSLYPSTLIVCANHVAGHLIR